MDSDPAFFAHAVGPNSWKKYLHPSLVGIGKKNAIMIIDVVLDKQRPTGESAHEAIYEGALRRFRPIMMTTMAALMATLPIALGSGARAESRRPLGLAVVGGLVSSQLLTLYITPRFPHIHGFVSELAEINREAQIPEGAAGSERSLIDIALRAL